MFFRCWIFEFRVFARVEKSVNARQMETLQGRKLLIFCFFCISRRFLPCGCLIDDGGTALSKVTSTLRKIINHLRGVKLSGCQFKLWLILANSELSQKKHSY